MDNEDLSKGHPQLRLNWVTPCACHQLCGQRWMFYKNDWDDQSFKSAPLIPETVTCRGKVQCSSKIHWAV